MTDPLKQAYDASVFRALRYFPKAPPWVAEAMDRMYTQIPTALPASPMAALTAAAETLPMNMTAKEEVELRVSLLVQRGWDLGTSIAIFESMRRAFPNPALDPQVWRLLSRQQLAEEFGVAMGHIVADVCSDPTSQPILAALIFGETRTLISPEYAKLHVSVVFALEELYKQRLPPDYRVIRLGQFDHQQVRDQLRAQRLPTEEACEIYFQHTRRRLEPAIIDLRSTDNVPTASEATIRQADRRFGPFGWEAG